jgi:hypothetical protein
VKGFKVPLFVSFYFLANTSIFSSTTRPNDSAQIVIFAVAVIVVVSFLLGLSSFVRLLKFCELREK